MFSGFGGASASKEQKEQQEMQERMEKLQREKLPGYPATQYLSLGFDMVLSILMIVGGIGLVMMKSWGRMLSLAYAGLSILYHIYSLVYAYAFVVPLLNTFFEEEAARNKALAPMVSAMKAVVIASPVLGAIVVIYPIVVIIIMMLPSVSAAFRAKPELEAPADEYDEGGFRLDLRRKEDDRFRPEEP